MFENLLKALEQLSGTDKLTFDIAADDKGYIDRECPDERCKFQFKVKPDTGGTRSDMRTCPMCGHSADATHFHTTEQVEQAQEMAVARIEGSLDEAMRRDARDFNSRQPKNAFLKMSLQVTGGEPYTHVDVPIAATEAMQLEIKCEACQAEYAVVGAAFFCPLCGHSSADRVFDDALRKIAAKRDNAPGVRIAIAAQAGKDEAELVARSMVESCLADGVVAFQRFCEVTYRRIPGVKEPPFNVFQRLADGSRLWRDACGSGYEDWLTPNELAQLQVLFQRRHLLAHSDGIVDAKYLTNCTDTSYSAGQRIVVSPGDVDTLISSLSALASGIRSRV
jgi:predicted RNA-binding Zn-ribbon protein involved in translation (DUF1610 family)